MAKKFNYTKSVHDKKTDFPTTGNVTTIYIDASDNKAYRWDDAYYDISSNELDLWGAIGDVSNRGGGSSWGDITGTLSDQTDLQTALDAKQDDLVSGTNIKTINGSSVLGSGNLSISGGASGIHALLKLTTGQQISAAITATTINSTALIANRLLSLPFIPAQTFTCSNLYINAGTAVAGGLGRILIYSDVNGIPTTKLYESANLDLSTSGIKTATTSFTFNQGDVYWLTIHSNSTNSVSALGVGSLMFIRTNGVSQVSGYSGSATFGSAPTTYPSLIFLTSTVPAVFITAS
jgi:hypothetical protein